MLPDSQAFNRFQAEQVFDNIGRRVMLVTARRLEHVHLILLGIRDDTEQSRTEEILRESEARHWLIVEGALDHAILTTSLDGTIESWSPGAAAVVSGHRHHSFSDGHMPQAEESVCVEANPHEK